MSYHSIFSLKRVSKAFGHSLDGLREAFKLETAFKQEIIIGSILLIIAILSPLDLISKAILIFSSFIVLITELLNSAIEWTVNFISPNYHLLAKRIKDIASAAVFLSLLQYILIWIFIFFNHFLGKHG